MTLRPATVVEIASLSAEAVNDGAIGSADTLAAYAASAAWKVQVSPAGDAVVFDRWREHLDWLAMRAVWAAPARLPVVVEGARAVARDNGFGRVMSPLIATELARPYERAGMSVATELVILRRDVGTADAMKPPVLAPEGIALFEGSTESIDALLALDHASFEPLWAYDRTILEGYLTTDRLVEARTAEGSLAGFTLSLIEGGQGSLGRLAVDPALRRRGLGAALVEDAVRALAWQGVSYVTLTTQIENRAARALYAACGFRELRGTLVALTTEA
jgi:[ribosomal protein S18]-alanine N-acetyltransferase